MARTFRRVGRLNSGYAPQQVDDFLARAKLAYARAQNVSDEAAQDAGNSAEFADAGARGEMMDESTVREVSFDWVRNGYDPALVDAALDRLETAFVQRCRAAVLENEGEEAWLQRAYAQAQSLYPRMMRPAGSKFAQADGIGYAKSEVDDFLNRLSNYFNGTSELDASDIREVTFKKARGSQAYDEAVVDVYLDRAVNVLLAVE